MKLLVLKGAMHAMKIINWLRWLGLVCFLVPFIHAQNIQTDCPAGTSNVGPVSPTQNLSTGNLNKWLCQSVDGSVASNFNGSNAPAIMGPLVPLNLVLTRLHSENIATGNTNLFTVPAGKKAMVGITNAYNNSGVGNILVTPTASFDSGGTYKIVGAQITIANGATGIPNWGHFIFSAGDIIAVTTATNNALNVFGTIWLFDEATPLRSVKLTALSNGNNTLYTVPAGKHAYTPYIMGQNYTANNSGARASATVGVVTSWNYVSSGGSVAGTNQVFSSTIAANNFDGPTVGNTTMNPGDFVNVAPATGASISLAFITVYEY